MASVVRGPGSAQYVKTRAGFTLIEVAIVLAILGALLGALLIPLGAQIDARNYRAARSDLNQVNEALLGYAMGNYLAPLTGYLAKFAVGQ